MQISFCNQNDIQYEAMLNDFLKEVFFDFQFWFDLHLWDQSYESYSVVENGRILSNICIFKTLIQFEGKPYTALSLGAVGTRDTHRGKGLSRMLMEHILRKYQDVPMYLSANESVLDFYPRFGFKRVYDMQPVVTCEVDNTALPCPLAVDDPKVRAYVYERQNYAWKLDCLNTQCIQMFHIHSGAFNGCLFELPELSAMIIASQQEEILLLHAVYSRKDVPFEALKACLSFQGVKKIVLGFTPHWTDLRYDMHPNEQEIIFARGVCRDLGKWKFPELSFT